MDSTQCIGDASAVYRFLPARFREPEDLRGTFAPFFRASLSPIAIACLRLFTLRPEPLFSVPFFLRCIVDFTFFEADLPYFAIAAPWALSPLVFFIAAVTNARARFLPARPFTSNRFP
jgi:hypothetical protein